MNDESKKKMVEEKEPRPIEGTVIGTGGYLVQVPMEEEGLEEKPIEQIVEMAEKAVEALKNLRIISLRQTTEKDWIDQNGKPYLMDDGCAAVSILWGVDHFDLTWDKKISKDDKGEFYIYTAHCKFYSKKLRRYIEEMGVCSQRDQFFGVVGGEFKKVSEIDEASIIKAAVTNCKNRGVKKCVGLTNITYEELEAAGLDVNKIVKIEYKKGAKKTEKTLSQEALRLRKEIDNMAMQMAGGDQAEADGFIKQESMFEIERDGKKEEKFAANIQGLTTEKWIKSTHKRMKAAFQKAYPDEQMPLKEEEK